MQSFRDKNQRGPNQRKTVPTQFQFMIILDQFCRNNNNNNNKKNSKW